MPLGGSSIGPARGNSQLEVATQHGAILWEQFAKGFRFIDNRFRLRHLLGSTGRLPRFLHQGLPIPKNSKRAAIKIHSWPVQPRTFQLYLWRPASMAGLFIPICSASRHPAAAGLENRGSHHVHGVRPKVKGDLSQILPQRRFQGFPKFADMLETRCDCLVISMGNWLVNFRAMFKPSNNFATAIAQALPADPHFSRSGTKTRKNPASSTFTDARKPRSSPAGRHRLTLGR